MAGGGRSRGPKRKRNWNIEYSSFPGESPLKFRRAGLRTVGAAASLSEAWLRCGEGFQDASGTLSSTAEKKTITEKYLELSPRPKKETVTSQSTSGLRDLTQSFSGSDLSDEDELQFIDWEIDSDREDISECNEFEDDESAVEISDCASCASSHSLTSEERLSELPKRRASRKTEWTAESREICHFFVETSVCFLPKDTFRQKLIIPNGSFPVILNTYFCQKVVAKEDSKTTHEMHCWDVPLPRRNITLAQMFRFKSPTNNSPENQVMCSGLTAMGTHWTHGHKEAKQHYPAQAPLRDSLLDAVENQGATTLSGGGVRVVVQRVYSLPCRCQQGGGSAASPGSDPPKVRVCLLVQDAYGMFGEVYSEGTILKNRQLEGKSCRLAGMKVLQKATRGRTAGLFSLIDIMWPPVISLKAAGYTQACEEQVKAHLPPPSFCYVLTAHPNLGQIDIIEEDPISKLYRPPIPHCLREILQTDDLSTCCSFYARVIYQRPQQREICLVVTDVTLQMQDENNSGLPKTVPVCVASSCVLDPEVLEALSEAAPHTFLFKDALRDQGQIVCVERTVLMLQKPLLGVASDACSCELTGPVKLDELDSVTQVNSICSVQGAVVGVDESTAFSWPTCDLCGNERLKQSPEDRGAFSCGDCSRVVTSPLLRRHLQVFLDCPSRPQCTVRVKLLQSSIASLLRFAACDDGTYEVKSVLGKEVGLLNCFVQSITTHPTSCIGLEEIELLSAGRASSEHRQLP
ncbi:DNA repair-scaffolding protein isoform X8 [Equus quagga]|uniref:DNA repair-scaffolding protein isoform X8 n=1 Tax=Equus quagga TaxID=89248 RepID=UPI001EE3850A|nr:DNA repair-scaffolding protein isoform X8 [Equus quagga]